MIDTVVYLTLAVVGRSSAVDENPTLAENDAWRNNFPKIRQPLPDPLQATHSRSSVSTRSETVYSISAQRAAQLSYVLDESRQPATTSRIDAATASLPSSLHEIVHRHRRPDAPSVPPSVQPSVHLHGRTTIAPRARAKSLATMRGSTSHSNLLTPSHHALRAIEASHDLAIMLLTAAIVVNSPVRSHSVPHLQRATHASVRALCGRPNDQRPILDRKERRA